jgi:hypothetical protein
MRLLLDLDSSEDEEVQECLCSGCTFLEIHVACSGMSAGATNLDPVKITSALDTYQW